MSAGEMESFVLNNDTVDLDISPGGRTALGCVAR